MKKIFPFSLLLALLTGCCTDHNKKIEYPVTKKGDVVDTIFGHAGSGSVQVARKMTNQMKQLHGLRSRMH